MPGYYYFKSRYDHPGQFFLFILKNWLCYPLILCLSGILVGKVDYISALLCFAGYLGLYDILAYDNDRMAEKGESSPTLRIGRVGQMSVGVILCKIVITAVMAILVRKILGHQAFLAYTAILVFAVFVFFIHNRIRESARFATFFLLHVIRGLIFLCPVMSLSLKPEYRAYLAAIVLLSLADLPQYIQKKMQTQAGQQGWVNAEGVLLMKPVVIKNLLILPILLLDPHYMILLAWIDSISVIELLLNRKINKGDPVK